MERRTFFWLDLQELLGRTEVLFERDWQEHEAIIEETVKRSSFLVIGGGGSIGIELVKELFRLQPTKLHVVNLGENSTVELVRDIRSSLGYIPGDFRTFVFDVTGEIFPFFLKSEGPYDYVLNLSAMKNLRSEADPYSLMRTIEVNVVSSVNILNLLSEVGVGGYFAASSSKAVYPTSMMGATKRLMEFSLLSYSEGPKLVTTRLPNVAFSAGSLLGSLEGKLIAQAPIVAPKSVRYFITAREAARLCLLTTLFAEDRAITFPRVDNLPTVSFEEIVRRFLKSHGYEALELPSEAEARAIFSTAVEKRSWPCHFYNSEEQIDEFFHHFEVLDLSRFKEVGVAKVAIDRYQAQKVLSDFLNELGHLRNTRWTKEELVALINTALLKLEGTCSSHHK